MGIWTEIESVIGKDAKEEEEDDDPELQYITVNRVNSKRRMVKIICGPDVS